MTQPPAPLTEQQCARCTPHHNSYMLIEGSLGRLVPGATYCAADIYAYYVALSEEQGLIPVTANRYGRHLKTLGLTSGRDSSGSRRVWTMPAAS